MKTFADHFPAGTETGLKTEAAPAIWENADDFRAKAEKLSQLADAQLATVQADQAGVGATMQAVGAHWCDCHATYSLPRRGPWPSHKTEQSREGYRWVRKRGE